MQQLPLVFDAPAPPRDPVAAEADALIAEAEAIAARLDAGAVTPTDRAALVRIGARADALGYINLGTHADMLGSLIARNEATV